MQADGEGYHIFAINNLDDASEREPKGFNVLSGNGWGAGGALSISPVFNWLRRTLKAPFD